MVIAKELVIKKITCVIRLHDPNNNDLNGRVLHTEKEIEDVFHSKEGLLIKKVFDIDQIEPTVLIEHDNNYFIIELTKTENIQRKVTDQSVKKEILLNLKKQNKRKLISEIISKINKNNFKKNDFDKLSKDEKVVIKKIRLENRNDDNILKQELINQIYAFSEKKVIVVADIEFSENFSGKF